MQRVSGKRQLDPHVQEFVTGKIARGKVVRGRAKQRRIAKQNGSTGTSGPPGSQSPDTLIFSKNSVFPQGGSEKHEILSPSFDSSWANTRLPRITPLW